MFKASKMTKTRWPTFTVVKIKNKYKVYEYSHVIHQIKGNYIGNMFMLLINYISNV